MLSSPSSPSSDNLVISLKLSSSSLCSFDDGHLGLESGCNVAAYTNEKGTWDARVRVEGDLALVSWTRTNGTACVGTGEAGQVTYKRDKCIALADVDPIFSVDNYAMATWTPKPGPEPKEDSGVIIGLSVLSALLFVGLMVVLYAWHQEKHRQYVQLPK
jgi:hypothetical protein